MHPYQIYHLSNASIVRFNPVLPNIEEEQSDAATYTRGSCIIECLSLMNVYESAEGSK